MTPSRILQALALASLAAGPGCGESRGTRSIAINEVLVKNHRSSLDADGNRAPWVELVNHGASPVSLSELFLSDDPRSPLKWPLPEFRLQPGAFFLVWCSGKKRLEPEAASFHADCSLEGMGQTLILSTREGALVDALMLPPQVDDRSYGRSPDGTGDFLYHLQPTPRLPNRGAASRRPIAARARVDPGAGRYPRDVRVSISTEIPVDDLQIRYTLDGSTPTASSERYEAPIELKASPFWPGKALRAAVFSGKAPVSLVRTESYFLGGEAMDLPVLAISMDPMEFRTVHYDLAGRGRQSEREGVLEIFDPGGRRRASIGMGLRLHGQTSRHGRGPVRKSYRVHFRDPYGDGKLRYSLIRGAGVDGFERVVLRASNDDSFRTRPRATYLRDQLLRDLHQDMGALVSRGDWYNLFVNMDPRGPYNVAERIDADFFRAHVPPESGGAEEWDVIHDGEVVDGDLEAWNELGGLLEEEGLRDEELYRRIQTRIDVESYTAYMILNVWAQNHDWPHKNFFAARPRRPGGRWSFLSWDAEMTLGLYPEGYEADTFLRALHRGGSVTARLFPALMSSGEYRSFFLRELDRHLQGALSPTRVLRRLEALKSRVGRDLTRDLGRRYSPDHVALWQRNYQEVVRFVERRGEVIRALVVGSPAMKGTKP